MPKSTTFPFPEAESFGSMKLFIFQPRNKVKDQQDSLIKSLFRIFIHRCPITTRKNNFLFD